MIHTIFSNRSYFFSGGRVLCYLIFGSVMAMGLHPVAGEFTNYFHSNLMFIVKLYQQVPIKLPYLLI